MTTTMTLGEKLALAAELAAIPELRISRITTHDDTDNSYAKTETHIAVAHTTTDTTATQAEALQFAFRSIDTPSVTTHEIIAGETDLSVWGVFRGLPVCFCAKFTDPAARDLIRSFPKGDVKVLAALAAPVPSPAAVRDALWAACDGPSEQSEPRPKPLISQSTIDEMRDLGVCDAHQIHTEPAGSGRHEAICSCDWVSNEAYGDATTAALEGYEHVKKMVAEAKATDTVPPTETARITGQEYATLPRATKAGA